MDRIKYKQIKKIVDKYNFNNFEAIQNYGIFCGDQNLYKILTIYEIIQKIKNLPGDIIEFGVWNGNTSFLIKKILDIFKIKKNIFLYDHFLGLKNFSEKDNKKNSINYLNKYTGSKDLIKDVIKFYDFNNIFIIDENAENINSDRFKNIKFSLIIIDVDLYLPTKKILDNISNNLVKNGLIVFDEGNKKEFIGEKKALEEFYNENKEKFEIEFLDKKRQPDVIMKKLCS